MLITAQILAELCLCTKFGPPIAQLLICEAGPALDWERFTAQDFGTHGQELFRNVTFSFHIGSIVIYSMYYQIQRVFNRVLKDVNFTKLLCHDCVLLAWTLTWMSLLQIKKCQLLLWHTLLGKCWSRPKSGLLTSISSLGLSGSFLLSEPLLVTVGLSIRVGSARAGVFCGRLPSAWAACKGKECPSSLEIYVQVKERYLLKFQLCKLVWPC